MNNLHSAGLLAVVCALWAMPTAGCSSDSEQGAAGAAGSAGKAGSAGQVDGGAGTGTGGTAGAAGGTAGTAGEAGSAGTAGNAGTAGSGGTAGAAGTAGNAGQAGAAGSTGCGSLVYSNEAACQDCAEANCCTELAACDTGTACDSLMACLNACTSGDQACQQACMSNQQAGVADLQALVDCVDGTTGKCMTECGAPGAICDSGLVNSGSPECGDCDGTNCCAEFTACAQDSNCMDCITGQGGTGCDADPLLSAALGCQKSKCANACPQGICDSGLTTNDATCDTCLGTGCCTELKACVADAECINCLTSATPPSSCQTNALFTSASTCVNTNCQAECPNL